MKARKGLKWLAAGLVMAASMVLLGCPHNNLIEHDVVSGSGATSGRGSNGGVKLVITNFTDNSAGTNRANNAVLNPLRTIAPDHIDLTTGMDNYVYVANGTGSNGDTYGPQYITLDAGTAFLGITGAGVWNITVEAYEVAALLTSGMTGPLNTDIMTEKTADQLQRDGTAALVLKGSATLNLDNGNASTVTMTLSNDGVGTEGKVSVDVHFDTTDDRNKIRDNSYDVKVALYDYVTGEMVPNSDETIISGIMPNNPDVYNPTRATIGKGRYQFRLSVVDGTSGQVVAYWVDDIYVEGNRTTNAEVHITDLFNSPSDLSDLKVYYSGRRDSDLKDGYLAYIAWAGLSYNAVGIELEIADITQWYRYEGSNHKANFTGIGTGSDVTIDTADALWDAIDADSDVRDAVVTTISWDKSPQEVTRYPAIWMEGSLLNGSSSVAFMMQTGHVYSVRARAAGAQAPSDWFTFGTAQGAVAAQQPSAVVGAGVVTPFDKTNSVGLFDLYEVFYELGDAYLLNKAGAGGTFGTNATASDLISYHQYDPAAGYQVSLKYTDMSSPAENDWFLYPKTTAGGLPVDNIADRITTWSGWKNKNGSDEYTKNNSWTPYTGHSNLTLVQLGATGSVSIKSETSGTFNVLDENKVLVDVLQDESQLVTAVGWGELTNSNDSNVKNTGLGLGKDNTRYILNLSRGAVQRTFLYVAVGKDPTAPNVGKLMDENGNEFTVSSIEVTLKKGLTTYKTFTQKVGPMAVCGLDGMASGDYTLEVKILTSSGYWQSYQVPLAIKYDDQIIP